jgi:hypothetical protein
MIVSLSVTDRTLEAPEHVAQLVRGRDAATTLVLIPDDLAQVDNDVVAGFRVDAQDLRVAALEAGLPVEVALPPGARAGHYTEHAADWVLPLILGTPAAVVATLIATHVQRRLDAWRAGGTSRTPLVRYREVVAENSREVRIREIEGPAEEVLNWLREERDGIPKLPSKGRE